MAKSIVDYIAEEDYARYNELLNIAEQNKANAPKPERKPRAPMTTEQKKASLQKRMANAQAKLDALLAAELG
jgi:hypothetical protein